MTFVSRYAGYTGSASATTESVAKISWRFALSLLPPSLTKISSGPSFTPRAPKSCSLNGNCPAASSLAVKRAIDSAASTVSRTAFGAKSEVLALARSNGSWDDPLVRAALHESWAGLQVLRQIARFFRAARDQSSSPQARPE